jgi:serine/threonine-protein kinase
VKVLAPELTGGVNIDRFKREIQLAARLQHPHIVPLLAAGDVDGLPYFTMPLVEGESLGARLLHGELPVADTVAILRDVAKALEYAHSKGVVHRDIKPDNVLLSGGSATVTDFGVAKALSSATRGDSPLTGRGIALGTPSYMSPEQSAADPNADYRADIYSFGVMAYEMLAGRAPFAGRSMQQLLSAHATEAPLPIERVRPAVPLALATLVMCCLEKRPADRPQSARELLTALDAVVTPAGTTETSTGGSVQTRRRSAIAAGVLALAVVVVAAIPTYRAFARGASRPKRLVVVPLANLTGDTAFAMLGRVAAEVISQGIRQTEMIEVVSSSVVAVATEKAPGSGVAPGDLAQRVQATVLVSGAVSRQGDPMPSCDAENCPLTAAATAAR